MSTTVSTAMMSLEHLGHAAALACAALWAFSTVLFGAAARTVDARALNLLKCALGALLLGVTALALGDLPHVSASDSTALVVSAVLGIVIADTAYFVALKELGPARGALFVALVPVCTTLFAVPALHEVITARMALGMAITLTGVTVVMRGRVAAPARDGSGRRAVGVAGGVVYCTAQGAANVLTKGTDPSLSPLALSFFRLTVGAAILGALLVCTRGGRASVKALRPVLARGATATFAGAYVGLLLGTFALRTVTSGVATTLVATTPLFALGIARVVDGETPSARTIAGAAVAVVGVALLVS